jgi:nucleotide-binding universal stress UspA family protein
MYKKILIGLDGSEGSLRALAQGIDVSARLGAELHTISIEEVPRYAGTMGEVLEAKSAANGMFGEAIEKAREMAARAGIEIKSHVLVGHEVKSIVEFVKEYAFDLLVVGFMGHSAIYDRVMGGTCQGLVRLAPCSVLVVK